MDVENINFSTTMLGTPVSIPFYVTATALGKLGNPEGEVILTRGAHKRMYILLHLRSLLYGPLRSLR